MYRGVVESSDEHGEDPASLTTIDSPATVVLTSGRRPTADAPLPTHLGRYVIIEQIGRGGMGRVARAYDPKLRREVALKLVVGNTPDSEARTRIVREAQAMAQLSHPNIVPVYDVEHQRDGIYIAMEYVRGDTLATWLAKGPHTWQEVLSRYLGAGQGLVAAHAAGMVHRDFKPSNVMIGSDDRVRVMDFGLVRTADALGTAEDDAARVESSDFFGIDASGDRTVAGVVMGTLHYMAPEQHRGEAVGPAADQYAFCVALYEGLFGVRPFSGKDAPSVARAKERGVPDKPAPAGTSVPAWLRAAVLRGLEPSPAARWPSMEGLLAALEHGRTRSRRRRVMASVLVVAAGASAVFAIHEIGERRRAAACEAEGQTVYEHWNDESRASLRAGLAATAVSYAGVTADKLMPWLDRHAEAWAQATTEACVRANVASSWDVDTYERAQWCLAELRMAHAALIDALSQTDATGVRGAVTAAAGFPSESACLDTDRLRRMPAPPAPEIRSAVDEVRAELSRASGMRAAGRYDVALSTAEAALQRAKELQWSPLIASTELEVGLALGQMGRHDEQEHALERAYFTAANAGEIEVAAVASVELTHCVGYWLVRKEDGLRWAQHAEVALREGWDREGLIEARLSSVRAAIHLRSAEFEDSKVLHEKSLALRESALGLNHPDVALALGSLANSVQSLGNYQEGIELHERALSIAEAALGPEHPDVATILNNLANARHDTGDYAEARALNERALAIRTQALGPDHIEVASTLNNLGSVFNSLGDRAKARESYERALPVLERTLGPDHPEVGATLGNLASLLREAGQQEEAVRLLTRALAIQEKSLGPGHPEVAMFVNNLAVVYSQSGSDVEAKPLYERALAILEKSLGPEHPELVLALDNLANACHNTGEWKRAEELYLRSIAIQERGRERDDLAIALLGLAHIALETNRAAEAATYARRALDSRERLRLGATEIADAQWLLARAQWESGGDRAEARQLAKRAVETYAAAGEKFATPLAEARAWLTKHAQP